MEREARREIEMDGGKERVSVRVVRGRERD